MAEYFKKPQNPLKKTDEESGDIYYIYPLTTADQIIMENGSRLNTFTDVLSVDENDEGKFLRVVNGLPVWKTISNAEEASF